MLNSSGYDHTLDGSGSDHTLDSSRDHTLDSSGCDHTLDSSRRGHTLDSSGHDHTLDSSRRGHTLDSSGHDHTLDSSRRGHTLNSSRHDHALNSSHDHAVTRLSQRSSTHSIGLEHRPRELVQSLGVQINIGWLREGACVEVQKREINFVFQCCSMRPSMWYLYLLYVRTILGLMKVWGVYKG